MDVEAEVGAEALDEGEHAGVQVRTGGEAEVVF